MIAELEPEQRRELQGTGTVFIAEYPPEDGGGFYGHWESHLDGKPVFVEQGPAGTIRMKPSLGGALGLRGCSLGLERVDPGFVITQPAKFRSKAPQIDRSRRGRRHLTD